MRNRRRERGEGLLSYVIAIILLPIAIYAGIALWNESTLLIQLSSAAQQTKTLQKSVAQYVTTNLVTVLASATAAPTPISLTALKTNGSLYASFPLQNPYQATYEVCATLDTNGLLKIITSASGGEQMPRRYAAVFAWIVGAGKGGWMDVTTAAQARGAYASFVEDLTPIATGCTIPTALHEASIEWFDPVALGADGLKVVGIYNLASGDLVPKPSCPGTLTPAIHLSQSTSAATSPAEVISAEQTWADNASATQWQVQYRALTETGWHTPNGTIARIMAVVICTP